MDFVVDRKTWFRGKGSDESRLLRADGMRCCIGFVGQQCGVPDSSMLQHSDIQAMRNAGKDVTRFPYWMSNKEINFEIGKAYEFNDDEEISNEERENRLSDLFAKHGDTITFVD